VFIEFILFLITYYNVTDICDKKFNHKEHKAL